MIKTVLSTLTLVLLCSAATAGPATMRLDYYHTGNSAQELFSVDRVVIEPLPWPGDPRKAIDDTNLGKYLFEVRDQKSKGVLYSRGFASIFGEWEATDEAQTMLRTFHESLRFPAPESTVEVVVKKRDAKNSFREVWATVVDPKDQFIVRSKTAASAPLITIQKMGDPAAKVDLLILGDGYTARESKKFEADARRLTEALFTTSPFKERRQDFNVWGLCPPANESGISRPSTSVYRDSPLGVSYDAFGSERYVLTFDNRALRKAAASAPYEFIEILANNRTYGGGGIFNLYGTVAVDSAWANYLFVHEFGHQFAGLADEYYTSPVAYAPAPNRLEPWEPNVTALLAQFSTASERDRAANGGSPPGQPGWGGGSDRVTDPTRAASGSEPGMDLVRTAWGSGLVRDLDASERVVPILKWRDLVSADTPIPTPWHKEAFESYSREIQKRRAQLRKDRRPEAEMEALFSEELDHERAMFAREQYAGRVGAFEGANYEAKGYYRPEVDCIMFSRTKHFCAACRRAIERIIDLYSRRS
jgi:hypothetical protein